MKSHILWCVLLLGVFAWPNAWGQKRSVADTARANLLNRNAFAFRESDLSKAQKYSQDALSLSEEINYSHGKIKALSNLGWIHYRRSDFVKALQYSIESIKLAEQTGDLTEGGSCRNNMAAVFFEQKQYGKALHEFQKALDIAVESNDERLRARTLNNIAYFYTVGRKKPDSAALFAQQALSASEDLGDSYLASFALRTLGDAHAAIGNLANAQEYFRRAITLSEKNKNMSMKAATYHRMAGVYLRQGNLEGARSLLMSNIELSEQNGYREELERTYQVLADLHDRLGNHKEAFQYLSKYTTLHDSIYTRHSSEQLALLQSQYELDMKQAQIELLTKDAVMKQDEIGRQRLQLYITILTATSAILLVIVLLYSFQKSKRANRELNQQKEQLAQKNAEVEDKRIELARLNATKDKLFSIIGHDFRSPLHSLKGLLSLIANKNMSQEEFEVFSVDLRKKIDIVYDNLDNILNWSVTQLKGISANPSIIEPSLLVEEVFDLYEEMARGKGVQLINQVPEDINAHADKDQIRLVMRNLISNALKFTAKGHVRVSAELSATEVMLSVEDTGRGISDSDLTRLFVKDSLWSVQGTQNEKGLGLGLLLCKEFIEKNNGVLTVTSSEGMGTNIQFTLPLPAAHVQLTQDRRSERVAKGKRSLV